MKDRIIHAFDIDPNESDSKINWDTYIKLNSVIKFNTADKETLSIFLEKLYKNKSSENPILKKDEANEILNTLFA